jgi:hypothetical protein
MRGLKRKTMQKIAKSRQFRGILPAFWQKEVEVVARKQKERGNSCVENEKQSGFEEREKQDGGE